MSVWPTTADSPTNASIAADPRRRVRVMLVVLGLGLLVVFARCAQLALGERDAYLAALAQPTERIVETPAKRGRILSRDGQVLAVDEAAVALAIDYRHLQCETDAAWLRRLALNDLDRKERSEEQKLEQAIERKRQALADMHRELAAMCGLSQAAYDTRRERIERQVERIAESVNSRRQERFEQSHAPRREFNADAHDGWRDALADAALGLFAPPEELPPRTIPVREQRAHHTVHVGLPLAAVAYIESHSNRFPGVRIETASRRAYPHGSLAAHTIGYVGLPNETELADATTPEESVGKRGAEKQWQSALRGTPGRRRQLRSPRGQLLEEEVLEQASAGRDVLLSIDTRLQRAAEALLDRACQRADAPGGAVVVMDARTGALLALASSPRFDPAAFAQRRSGEIEQMFDDPRRPMFDRSLQMALPPGSVFKLVSAVAILEAGQTTPDRPFRCRGYFDDPSRMRCALYRQQGIGHGDIVLADALAQSCNVYFFQHAGEIGHGPLVGWAMRFGFGQTSGVDLPGESPGELPTPRGMQARHGRTWQPSDTQLVAVGQGPITATPLQIASMTAAVANGGTLVAPSVLIDIGAADGAAEDNLPARRSSRSIGQINPNTLPAIRAGLQRVGDEHGTAHRALRTLDIPIAGKTGTAEAGGGRPDHAWFTGYAPVEEPHLVLVAVIEHGGSGGEVAAPLAGELIHQADRLGLLRR